MHGYEMMKALEERTGGFYAPSAGTIYPTLQMLEDRGLVTVQEVEGKKVYSITDAGRALLQERQQNEPTPPWERGFQAGRRWWHEPEAQALRAEATEVARLFAIATRKTFQDPQKLGQLREILSRARHDLTALIYDETTPQESATPTSEANDTATQEPPQA
jgi:DNA-binding PadR family transcriptional regulator